MCVFERRSRRSTRYCFVLVVNGRRRSLRTSSILGDLVREAFFAFCSCVLARVSTWCQCVVFSFLALPATPLDSPLGRQASQSK